MATYEELLAAAKSDPTHADFMSLRLAYTRSSQYNPYGRDSNRQNLGKALQEKRLQDALGLIELSLATNYVDPDTHMIAANVYRELQDQPHADYHYQWADGLLRSILNSGDGRSFETAMIVINTAEEYSVLGAFGTRLQQQRLSQHEDNAYDIMSVQYKGQPIDLYFNIDIPYQWLGQQHSKAK